MGIPMGEAWENDPQMVGLVGSFWKGFPR